MMFASRTGTARSKAKAAMGNPMGYGPNGASQLAGFGGGKDASSYLEERARNAEESAGGPINLPNMELFS